MRTNRKVTLVNYLQIQDLFLIGTSFDSKTNTLKDAKGEVKESTLAFYRSQGVPEIEQAQIGWYRVASENFAYPVGWHVCNVKNTTSQDLVKKYLRHFSERGQETEIILHTHKSTPEIQSLLFTRTPFHVSEAKDDFWESLETSYKNSILSFRHIFESYYLKNRIIKEENPFQTITTIEHQTDRNTMVFFHGTVKNDQRHGHGYLAQIEPTRSLFYDGEWVNNLRHGKGAELIFQKQDDGEITRVLLRGNWKSGKKTGLFEHIFSDYKTTSNYDDDTLIGISYVNRSDGTLSLEQQISVNGKIIGLFTIVAEEGNRMMLQEFYYEEEDVTPYGSVAASFFMDKLLQLNLHDYFLEVIKYLPLNNLHCIDYFISPSLNYRTMVHIYGTNLDLMEGQSSVVTSNSNVRLLSQRNVAKTEVVKTSKSPDLCTYTLHNRERLLALLRMIVSDLQDELFSIPKTLPIYIVINAIYDFMVNTRLPSNLKQYEKIFQYPYAIQRTEQEIKKIGNWIIERHLQNLLQRFFQIYRYCNLTKNLHSQATWETFFALEQETRTHLIQKARAEVEREPSIRESLILANLTDEELLFRGFIRGIVSIQYNKFKYDEAFLKARMIRSLELINDEREKRRVLEQQQSSMNIQLIKARITQMKLEQYQIYLKDLHLAMFHFTLAAEGLLREMIVKDFSMNLSPLATNFDNQKQFTPGATPEPVKTLPSNLTFFTDRVPPDLDLGVKKNNQRSTAPSNITLSLRKNAFKTNDDSGSDSDSDNDSDCFAPSEELKALARRDGLSDTQGRLIHFNWAEDIEMEEHRKTSPLLHGNKNC